MLIDFFLKPWFIYNVYEEISFHISVFSFPLNDKIRPGGGAFLFKLGQYEKIQSVPLMRH